MDKKKQDWPNWSWGSGALKADETAYLLEAGRLSGIWQHLGAEAQNLATVDLLTQDGLRASQIEGDVLDRASFQSWDGSLSEDVLLGWHWMVCNGWSDLTDVGAWRRQGDPMQVVSDPIQKPRVHFEALPTNRVASEMARFVEWFNAMALGEGQRLPAMARAVLAHLWFVSIRPFEDGNGRIARALLRLFEAGAEGFIVGLGAQNYITITGASTAIVRRDLAGLVGLDVLTRTGGKARGTVLAGCRR